MFDGGWSSMSLDNEKGLKCQRCPKARCRDHTEERVNLQGVVLSHLILLWHACLQEAYSKAICTLNLVKTKCNPSLPSDQAWHISVLINLYMHWHTRLPPNMDWNFTITNHFVVYHGRWSCSETTSSNANKQFWLMRNFSQSRPPCQKIKVVSQTVQPL